MSNWKKFEIECTNYLRNNFGKQAEFEHYGGSDSTIPDILVKCRNGFNFYIEAKNTPAQCGQFVLLPNIERKCFEYSSLNNSPLNTFSKQIMKHMNCYFDAFRKAGKKGENIDMNNGEKIFSEWIKEYYTNKGVKFFITNNFNIIPIERFDNFFNVSAIYRIKRSGSSEVGKSRISTVRDYISNNYNSVSIHHKGGKLYVSSSTYLHNSRFSLGDNEYMFSKREDLYEIRKLSNTYNANVIFSINYTNLKGISHSEFESYLH